MGAAHPTFADNRGRRPDSQATARNKPAVAAKTANPAPKERYPKRSKFQVLNSAAHKVTRKLESKSTKIPNPIRGKKCARARIPEITRAQITIEYSDSKKTLKRIMLG